MSPAKTNNMEDTIKSSVESGEIPGVALLAKDKTGKINYAQCFGVRSVKEGAPQQPMTFDTVMRIASASKLITSVACMQCVERGLLDLDADVQPLLPEVASMQILTGFNADGEPQLSARKKPLTLRHILSHSSGLCYDAMHPLLIKYRAYQGIKLQPGGDKIEDRFIYPLVYEPGDGWTYGPNLEWAGRLLERACDGKSLDDIVKQNICKPLGITDMTFKLQERPDMIASRAEMSERDANMKVYCTEEDYWHHDPVDAMGGMGIFTSPASYMKVLESLLMDDGKLLKSDTVDKMFQPQLEPQGVKAIMELYQIEEMTSKMGALLQMGVKKDHALGGMLVAEDLEAKKWRSKGTMTWSGLPNFFWCIDREAGLCALYASQLKPPGDEKSIELARLFERAMYERLRA